jgi:hypothetical protein
MEDEFAATIEIRVLRVLSVDECSTKEIAHRTYLNTNPISPLKACLRALGTMRSRVSFSMTSSDLIKSAVTLRSTSSTQSTARLLEVSGMLLDELQYV